MDFVIFIQIHIPNKNLNKNFVEGFKVIPQMNKIKNANK